MTKITTGLNLLTLTFCSAVMIFIILRLRKSQQDFSNLKQNELATRMTAQDVDEMVQSQIKILTNRLTQLEKVQMINQSVEQKQESLSLKQTTLETQTKDKVTA